MKVARGRFEASVTLGYLRLHQELADDFLERFLRYDNVESDRFGKSAEVSIAC